MYDEFLKKLINYAKSTSHIESVLIVGSYARGENKESSDLDIVIITTNKKSMVEKADFIKEFGHVFRKQTEYYGACTSIRTRYKDGKEVEFGLVEPSRISLPLDPGTYRVLSDGYKVIIDKNNYFDNLEL